MSTVQQIFKAAAEQVEKRNQPFTRILNRLGFESEQEIRNALAQQFLTWFASVQDDIDLSAKPVTLGEQHMRTSRMKTITVDVIYSDRAPRQLPVIVKDNA